MHPYKRAQAISRIHLMDAESNNSIHDVILLLSAERLKSEKWDNFFVWLIDSRAKELSDGSVLLTVNVDIDKDKREMLLDVIECKNSEDLFKLVDKHISSSGADEYFRFVNDVDGCIEFIMNQNNGDRTIGEVITDYVQRNPVEVD